MFLFLFFFLEKTQNIQRITKSGLWIEYVKLQVNTVIKSFSLKSSHKKHCSAV